MGGFARRNRAGLYLVRPDRARASGRKKRKSERARGRASDGRKEQPTHACGLAGHVPVLVRDRRANVHGRTATSLHASRAPQPPSHGQATAKSGRCFVYTYRLLLRRCLGWPRWLVAPQTRRMRCHTPIFGLSLSAAFDGEQWNCAATRARSRSRRRLDTCNRSGPWSVGGGVCWKDM
jgi:hypothetical protein